MIVNNVSCISEFKVEKNALSTNFYIKWLKKLISLKFQRTFTLILRFTFLKAINVVINRFLIWEEQVHVCERLFRNKNVKQCFNCWAYKHIENQCLVVTKCDRCENVKHEKNICSISKTSFRCAICENFHDARHKDCRVKIAEVKKLKTNCVDTIFFFVKRFLNKFKLSINIVEILSLLINVERRENCVVAVEIVNIIIIIIIVDKTQNRFQNLILSSQETTFLIKKSLQKASFLTF